MSAATEGSATVDVNGSASDVFAYLTDLGRLPGLSPENVRCEFLEGSTEVAVGSTFRGHNKARDYEWHADCLVTELEPAKAFAYSVPPKFEPPLLELPKIYPGKIEGRRDNLEEACQTTMNNLRRAFE
jgi:uncharacterized protein YndB with AHSA1/START domain